MRIASSTDQSLRSLSDFRGDFDELAAMMEESWSENKNQPLRYTAEFLQSCFRYPGASYELAPTMYCGEKPIGFVAGFPRIVRYKGNDLKLLVVAFLTVASEYKNRGYGIALWSELVQRARALGFDGMVNYGVEGEAMDGMIVGCCELMRLPVTCVYTIPYLFSILWPKPSGPAEDYSNLVQPFLDATAAIANSVPLARVWTREEATWQCTRSGVVIACHQAGSRYGMLTGYLMQLADANHTRTLLVEDVLWNSLEQQERTALVKQLTEKAAAQGARMAVVPELGYADMDPFRAARFRTSPRTLHAYLTLWSAGSEVEAMPSFYLDVF